MAHQPDVHIFGKTDQVSGIAADGISGSGEPKAVVEIALYGYGSQVIDAPSDGSIGRLTKSIEAATDGTWTFDVYTNAWLKPAGTYYVITIKDSNGDIAQVKAFQVMTPGQYGFSDLTPIDPDQPPPVIPTPPPTPEILFLGATDTMVFDGTNYTAFSTTLPGDVMNCSIANMSPGNLYTFIILQDAVGGHVFNWPPQVFGAANVNTAPNSATVQTFVAFNATTLYAIAPGTYLP